MKKIILRKKLNKNKYYINSVLTQKNNLYEKPNDLYNIVNHTRFNEFKKNYNNFYLSQDKKGNPISIKYKFNSNLPKISLNKSPIGNNINFNNKNYLFKTILSSLKKNSRNKPLTNSIKFDDNHNNFTSTLNNQINKKYFHKIINSYDFNRKSNLNNKYNRVDSSESSNNLNKNDDIKNNIDKQLCSSDKISPSTNCCDASTNTTSNIGLLSPRLINKDYKNNYYINYIYYSYNNNYYNKKNDKNYNFKKGKRPPLMVDYYYSEHKKFCYGLDKYKGRNKIKKPLFIVHKY